MKYFSIVKTNIPYDVALSRCKIIELEKNSKMGDIFGNYILASTGNPIISEDNNFIYDNYFKNGLYVNLFPLNYIDRIESDNGDLTIDGFTVYKDEKIFHPLIGFDKTGNELIDLDESKQKVDITYYYVRNHL